MENEIPENRTTLFYDGLCVVCALEMAHYQKLPGGDKLNFVDITSPTFDPVAFGLDPYQVHKEMHVRTKEGKLTIGVEAFIAIWQELPRYQWAAKVARNPIVHFLMKVGYSIFAKIRPYLPKKKAGCENSPYCETTKSKP